MAQEFFNRYFAITPHDSNNLSADDQKHVGIYVGVTGNVVAVMPDDTKVTFKGAVAGSVLPIRVKRIDATNTTATDLVGLRQI